MHWITALYFYSKEDQCLRVGVVMQNIFLKSKTAELPLCFPYQMRA